MQAGPGWTAARDAQVRRLRREGARWAEIGAALGVSPDVARERGRRLGAESPPAPASPPADDPHRPPLPPGDPRSWGLLTAETSLAGLPWPGWT